MEEIIKKVEKGEWLERDEELKLLEFPKHIIALYLSYHSLLEFKARLKLVMMKDPKLLEALLCHPRGIELTLQINIINSMDFEMFKVLVRQNAFSFDVGNTLLALDKDTRYKYVKEIFADKNCTCPIGENDLIETNDCELFKLYLENCNILHVNAEHKLIKLANKDMIKIYFDYIFVNKKQMSDIAEIALAQLQDEELLSEYVKNFVLSGKAKISLLETRNFDLIQAYFKNAIE